MYDQYSRFSAEIRRSLLLKVVHVDQSLFNNESHSFWGFPYHTVNAHPELQVPGFDLRGLVSSHIDLHSLVDRAVKDGIMTWADSINLVGENRDLLWMCCATSIRDIEEWKACLTAPCPNSATRQEWLYWAAQSVFREVSIKGDLADLESTIMAYKTACPHLRGLVPIALISIAFYLFENPFNTKNKQHINSFVNILRVLPNSGDSEIIQDLLLGTYKWQDVDSYDSAKDLLIAFIELSEGLVEEGLLEQDSLYERAINFVKELQKYRDSLTVS